jgi:hypothetical protein
MPSRSNLEARGTDRNGNRTGPRATVGEADPETRRKILRERLNEREPTPPPQRATRQPSTRTRQPDAFKVERAANDLRYRGVRIDEAVDKASK